MNANDLNTTVLSRQADDDAAFRRSRPHRLASSPGRYACISSYFAYSGRLYFHIGRRRDAGLDGESRRITQQKNWHTLAHSQRRAATADNAVSISARRGRRYSAHDERSPASSRPANFERRQLLTAAKVTLASIDSRAE